MKKINITINDKEYIADTGKTILEVINENKIDEIPTLCHDERITPYGSCFLCVIEIEGVNKLLPSCSSLVSDGMVIRTNSEKVRSARKTALELLLSNHYADCISPCQSRCPAGVNIQGYISLIANHNYKEAIALIKKNNPLPLICGRICVRECEIACRRNLVDESVAINFLKRYVADIDKQNFWKPKLKKRNGKKIAIVGGGPSGLSCAYFLTLNGYQVTIFEKLPKLGGMLRYGIPEYRLPKKILDEEINWIIDLGIEVKNNSELGKDFTLDELINNYKSVYLSLGAQKASDLRVPNEENTIGIFKGIDFLRNLQLNNDLKFEGTVVVVGGGNTAIDAARTALRCGAKEVKIVYRRSINEMPAHSAEIEAAKDEGVKFAFLTNPVDILKDNGKLLKGIECIKMRLEESKSGGRPRPIPIPDSEYRINCDYLISAIGQKIDLMGLDNFKGIEINNNNTIIVNEETMESSFNNVFAGGDVVTGPLTAINAIAHGKIAAESIDNNLRKDEKSRKEFISFKNDFGEILEAEYSGYKKSKRNKMPELEVESRISNFKEVELGYSDEQAIDETERCLECGCSEYTDCALRKYSSDYNIDISKFIGDIRKYKIDNRHPLINIDSNKCINCGRCVRTCSEILKVSALSFINRGFKSIVKPAMEKSLSDTNCISCGNCIAVCPTGAITEKLPFKIPCTLEGKIYESICNFCSIGCNLNYKVINNNMFYVSNSNREIYSSHNKGYLCVKGKFGYRYLLDKNRIQTPMINKEGKFEKISWDETFRYSSKRIKEIIAQYGPESVAVFGSPKMSNEELYLLQKFARVGLRTNNISSLSNLLYGSELDSLDEAIGLTVSTTTMDEIDRADIVVVINSDLSEENLIMELKIKNAKKNGTKLITINSSEIKLTKFADLWIDSGKGTNTVLLNGIMKELIKKGKIDNNFIENKTNGYQKFKDMVSNLNLNEVSVITDVSIDKLKKFINLLDKSDKNIVFIYNIDSHKEKSKNDLKAISNFLLLTNRINRSGNGVIILRDYANSTGLSDMGVTQQYLPGYIKYFEKDHIERIGKEWNIDLSKIFKPVDLTSDMMKGKIKAALVFGEDPLIENDNLKYFNGVDFLLVQDMFYTSTIKEADIVLPLTSYIEQNGTYTSCDRRIQKANKVLKTPDRSENWEIIMRLAENFNADFQYKSSEDIYDEIKRVNRFYNNCEISQFWGKNLFSESSYTINKKFNFSIYDIDISTINPEKPVIISSENYFRTKIRESL